MSAEILPRLRRGSTKFDWTFDRRYVPFFVDSGTTALRLAIEAALVCRGKPGSTWIPAYGCPDLVAATLAAGSVPCLYDVEGGSPFFRHGSPAPTHVGVAVAAHFLGVPAPLMSLRRALSRNVLVIEDSAQAFPPPFSDGGGDFVVLSFGRGKPVSLLLGGCLLVKPEYSEVVSRLLDRWTEALMPRFSKVLLLLHDIAVQPGPYSIVSKMPGMSPGRVVYRAAPRPARAPSNLMELASRVASGYMLDDSWIENQSRVENLARSNWPAAKFLARERATAAPPRLLRYPLIFPDRGSALDVVAELNSTGVSATQMYKTSIARVQGSPVLSKESIEGADEFAGRLVTLPLSRHWP